MAYDMGNDDLDERIAALVADASSNPGADLIAEIVTTALKLHRDNPDRGDLKLINTALKEMRYSDLVFSRGVKPRVTVFGSARTEPGQPNYELATAFAKAMADKGWETVTGAGPGIMDAANLGATREHGWGVNIHLPFEASANPHIAPERLVNFKYFFTRKLAFLKESNAFVIFPGGFGTLDEFFELLTLVQTGKTDLAPIIVMEAPGSDYWEPVLGNVTDVLSAQGMISAHDSNLIMHSHDVQDTVDEILGFYANYHSQRYVNGMLVLRMRTAPDDELLAQLNDEFADIVVDGEIERIEATDAEVRDDDHVDLDRLRLHYDRRTFGRLRLLVDRLNEVVDTRPDTVVVHRHTPEQAERPW